MIGTRLTFAVATLGLIGFGPVAQAQGTDPGVSRIIEQLRPSPQTRGIRVPGSEPPAAPVATPPAHVPATPAAVVRPSTPPPAPQTTAPDGVGALSITLRFATGSALLSSESARQLTGLGRALASDELRAFRFRIEGHTDTVGAADLNRTLSERRAQAVRDYLVQNFQIAPARLEAVGLGSSQLLVQTPDQTAEQRNRRVQIVNLGS